MTLYVLIGIDHQNVVVQSGIIALLVKGGNAYIQVTSM
jgi:hypothetical protein